jgi:hypothetical protein
MNYIDNWISDFLNRPLDRIVQYRQFLQVKIRLIRSLIKKRYLFNSDVGLFFSQGANQIHGASKAEQPVASRGLLHVLRLVQDNRDSTAGQLDSEFTLRVARSTRENQPIRKFFENYNVTLQLSLFYLDSLCFLRTRSISSIRRIEHASAFSSYSKML